MTSLIDVIFLLLLFFMLSSTFSRFSELELSAAASGAGAAPERPPLFLQLAPDSLRLNGVQLALENLGQSDLAHAQKDRVLLVSLTDQVSAQRLTDLLVALRPLGSLRVTVLEG